MKIAYVILGTRGDVQPMLALATGLMKKGHEVIMCAPPEHEKLAGLYSCPFIPFGPEIQKKIKENPEKQRGGIAVTMSPAQGKKIVIDQITLLPDLLTGVDLVLGAGIPQAAFPFMADQFPNRDQIVKLGLGPKTCNFKEISAKVISAAINECVAKEQYKANAVELSKRLEGKDGVDMTIQVIESLA